MSWVTPPSPASGSGSSATAAAQYLVLAVDGTLTGERDFTPAEGMGATDGGAGGDYSLSMTSRVLDRTGISIITSVTITVTLYSLIIQPNVLGSDKTIQINIFGTVSTSSTGTLSSSIAIVLGTTVMHEGLFKRLPQTTPVTAGLFIDLKLTGENSANAQALSGSFIAGLGSLGATTGIGNLASDETSTTEALFGTAAENSATTLTFAIIVKPHATSISAGAITLRYGVARLK